MLQNNQECKFYNKKYTKYDNKKISEFYYNLLKKLENLYIIIRDLFSIINSMVETEDMLMWYWVYKNVLEDNEKDENNSDDKNYDNEKYDERQEEIEDIMAEYGVDEDEAEEILDNM